MSVKTAFERMAMAVVAADEADSIAQDQENAMRGISVRLPDSLILLLDNIARELRTTRSEVMQTILANGADDAAQAIATELAPTGKESDYYKALHSPVVWGSMPEDRTGGE